MKEKYFSSNAAIMALVVSVLFIAVMSFTGCTVKTEAQGVTKILPVVSMQINRYKVYFATSISPTGLMAVYNALGQQPSGRVAVKPLSL